MRDGLLVVGVLLLGTALSALVKYVLPYYVQQPDPFLLWAVVLAPSTFIALGLWFTRPRT